MNHYQIPLDTAIEDLSEKQMKIIKYGTENEIEYTLISKDNQKYHRRGVIEGLVTKLARLYLETNSDEMRQYYAKFMSEIPCHVCKGKRLNPVSYTHLTLPTIQHWCRSRWSPYH